MSDFGDYKHLKTRKEHHCVFCGRKIPIGIIARRYKGMFEGDWQNWYTCGFCELVLEDDYVAYGESISGDEFNEWFSDSENFKKCPNGHKQKWPKHNQWDWLDETTIEVECDECDAIWKVGIPFEINTLKPTTT